MKITEVLVEHKSEFLKFIGDTNAGMALGKTIHSNARVTSDQTPTPVRVSSTMKFLEGPKWYAQMFAKSRIYILQGSSGWAAIYRRKDLPIDSRAQVELAISPEGGTVKTDPDIINKVRAKGEGSLPEMITSEIGNIQKTYWIENNPTSRFKADELKRNQRTTQSIWNRPNVKTSYQLPKGSNAMINERIKILLPNMVLEIKRELRQAVRRGELEPIENLDMSELFDSLDALAEDKVSWIMSVKNRFPGGASVYHLWSDAISKALKKKKIPPYSTRNPVQEVAEVFKLAKDKFRKELVKLLFTKP